MNKRRPSSDELAHTLMSFLGQWAASDSGTSYSEQHPSGSFRRIVFRLNREGCEQASLELVAGSDEGKPMIEVNVSNFDLSAGEAAHSRYPNWQAAIASIRSLRSGPMSLSIFTPDAAALRQSITTSFRERIAGLPEPIPSEMLEFLRDLEGSRP